MTYKWDAEAAENYAKELAAKICEENYVDLDALDGEQILEVTPIKQVNLLAVRLLYSRWQDETRRLQSPYFDFANPEVQYALSEFMNILSQFIAVRQREFQPLLTEAITNTIKLCVEPKQYFSQLLRDLPNFRLSEKWVKGNRNYFQIYKWIFDELQDIAEQHPAMYANEVTELIYKQLDQRNAEDISGIMQAFETAMPIPEELRVVENPTRSTEDRRPTGKSFFDSIVEEKLTDRIRQNVPQKPANFDPSPSQRHAVVAPEVVKPEVVEVVKKVEETIVEKPVQVEKNDDKYEIRSVNEQHVNVTQSLNDKATTTAMVTDYHRLSRVDSIRKSISLNQRFTFTKYLFNDSADIYNKSLDEIDQLQNYTDARSFVVHNYVPRFNWDVKSAEVDEFFEVLKRRFS